MSPDRKHIKKTVYWFLLLALTLSVVLLNRLPYIDTHFQDWDEAHMMNVAWAMTQGEVLYKDLYHVHPIFQFFIFIPFFHIFGVFAAAGWVKIFNIILLLINSVLISSISKKIFNKPWLSVLNTIIYVFFNSAFFWSLSSHGEFYFQSTVLLCFYLLLKLQKKYCSKKAILFGFLAGIGFFIKQIVIFDYISLIIIVSLFENEKNNIRYWKYKTLFKHSLIGFIAIFVVALIYPILTNSLPEAISTLFGKNLLNYINTKGQDNDSPFSLMTFGLRYLHIWMYFIRNFLKFNSIWLSLINASLIFGVILNMRLLVKGSKSISNSLKFLMLFTIWLSIDLMGITLIGRYYDHYLLQVIIPSSFIITASISFLPKIARRISICCLISFILLFSHKHYSDRNSWKQFKNHKLLSLNIAKYIKEKTIPTDKIFIYATTHIDVYYLSERLSSNGIYMYHDMDSAHMNDSHLETQLREKLNKNKPTFIISGPIDLLNERSSAEIYFKNLIRKHYKLSKEIQGIQIHQLIKTNRPY